MQVKIEIVSGEGAGQGTAVPWRASLNAPAIRRRLTRERRGGERWAHCRVDGVRVEDSEIGAAILDAQERASTAISYADLHYVVPPSWRGRVVEVGYAKTGFAIVRRVRDTGTGEEMYAAAHISALSGDFDPARREPRVWLRGWSRVSGDAKTY